MSADVVTLPPRPAANLPADLSAQLSAALATRNLINVIAELVRLPREQMVELSAEQLDTMAAVLQTTARTVRMMVEMDKGRTK